MSYMATTDDLVISIRADLDTLNRQLQQVDQRLNNTQQQGQQTGQSINNSFSGASDSVKNLAAAIGVVSNNDVFTDHIMAAVMNNTHVVLKIESGLGDIWQGSFAVPSCERSGEYNKEETFSASFESAGTITYTAA